MIEIKKDNNGRPYKELTIDSSALEIPRSIYQRGLDTGRVMRIVKNFDENGEGLSEVFDHAQPL